MFTKEKIAKNFYYKDGQLIHKRNPHKGKPAGRFDASNGYSRVIFLGHTAYIHRLVWTLHNGTIPDGCYIDHIDHDRTNNHIENLRCVTPTVSSQNRGKQGNNTSGFVGVWLHNRDKNWCVEINIDGKKMRLGCHPSKEIAFAIRKSAETAYGFYPNHGLDLQKAEA
jgi:hypothetical protein